MIAAELIRRLGTFAPAQPWRRRVFALDAWPTIVEALAATPAIELLAMWADTAQVHVLLHDPGLPEIMPLSVPVQEGRYPSLAGARPLAAWFERMIRDLWGHVAEEGPALLPWLDHGHFPSSHNLAPRPTPAAGAPEPYEFHVPDAEGITQFPFGPVRGLVETAGQLRLTCQGDRVIQAEALLGYTHKGILNLVRGKSPRAAARFAARLAGEATVAHSIAFARAAEAAIGTEAPPRAAALRAVMAEIERIAIHCADLRAICAAAGAPVPEARFAWHREAICQATLAAFGHRLMMDQVIPGGVAADIAPEGLAAVLGAVGALRAELPELAGMCAGRLAARLAGIGVVPAGLAAFVALGGPAGRASGRGFDARRVPGYPPYAGVAVPTAPDGDAAARLRLRLTEIEIACAALPAMLAGLPDGPASVGQPLGSGEGFGVAEGARGDCWCWLRLDNGLISAAFLADPGWRAWATIEAILPGAALSDVALIIRSIGTGNSGVDL